MCWVLFNFVLSNKMIGFKNIIIYNICTCTPLDGIRKVKPNKCKSFFSISVCFYFVQQIDGLFFIFALLPIFQNLHFRHINVVKFENKTKVRKNSTQTGKNLSFHEYLENFQHKLQNTKLWVHIYEKNCGLIHVIFNALKIIFTILHCWKLSYQAQNMFWIKNLQSNTLVAPELTSLLMGMGPFKLKIRIYLAYIGSFSWKFFVRKTITEWRIKNLVLSKHGNKFARKITNWIFIS